ncbi:hypothetical protein AQPE_3096 [Aquipluma nitroreducens]|uniref:Uncharacterized protein n=1 Tax=Aquipluma nitroreducens TaxID=2010828 RepID=A0A5K7SBU6_9BACT|nr:hypothetical protein AQPE_3096 [Aquipluma nitroreducens]
MYSVKYPFYADIFVSKRHEPLDNGQFIRNKDMPLVLELLQKK